MTWSNGRQLDSTNVGGMNLSYSYNADGQRTSKSRSAYYTDEYVYYGTQLSTLIRNGVGYKHSLTFIYDDNGQALGFYYDTNLNDSNPGTKYYYVCNAQGDVLQLRDHTNAPVANYYYDSWGKLLGITDANGNAITAFNSVAVLNPIRYRGYFYDTETGFYYLNSRYYDPQIGRFINADDVDVLETEYENFLQYNLYAYCFNNPVNMSDDIGLWPIWATNLVKVGIGALAIGIGVAATVATGGAVAPVLAASLKIAVTSAAIGSVVGAGTNVVKHRISTGSWSGAGKAALSGAVDGAADGFMWGGISAGVTFTTVAAKGVKIQQIGRLKPANKKGNGYQGVQYINRRGSLKSFELHSPHSGGPHNVWHWQQNTWNPRTGKITGSSIHWTLFGRRF